MADIKFKQPINAESGIILPSGDIQTQIDAKADTTYVDSQDALRIPLTQKGAANGVATLDAGSKIPAAQLPNTVMEYQGNWNATTNSPTLIDGTGNAGDVYRTSVAGTQNLGSGNQTFFVGDLVIYSGTIWQRSPTADGVTSVNGLQGDVILTTDEVDEGSGNLYFTDTRAQDALLFHTGSDAGIHGVAGEVVGTSDTQILTNKTIDADLNTITNIENADIKSGAAIDSLKIADGSVTNTEFQYLGGVTSDIQTQLNGKQATGNYITALTGDVTATGPGSVTATISALSATKIADGSVDNTEFQYLNGVTSSIQTQINARTQDTGFIFNGQAEVDTTGWATYADAASSRPVDGTGGSPTVTFTRTTSSPIKGSGSFIFTKDAANRQGEGASYDFTVPAGNQARVNNIFVDYRVVSGTFVAGSSSSDSDLIIYMYDVTNSQLIEPSSIKLLSNSTTLSDRFSASFQTSATGTQYRLIIHCATTSASAYVVMFDNITVSQSEYVYGTPITDWASYTSTAVLGSGSLTNATISAVSRRVGDNLEGIINVAFTNASAAFSGLSFTLPSGLSIDTNKLIGPASMPIGQAVYRDTSVASYVGFVRSVLGVTTSVEVMYNYTNTSDAGAAADPLQATSISNTVPFTFNNGDEIKCQFNVPITGWSSSVQMSDTTDTRVVAMRANSSSTSISSTPAQIVFSSVNGDTHGAYNASTGTYTIPVSGWYEIDSSLYINTTVGSVDQTAEIAIYRNGSPIKSIVQRYKVTGGTALSLSISDEFAFNAGDTLAIYAGAEGTSPTIVSSSTRNTLAIRRVTGPAAIAASETVACRYTTAAGQSIANGAVVIIDYGTKDYDTHNAVTTGASWKFTAPISGIYTISAFATYASASFTAGGGISFYVAKSGNNHNRFGQSYLQASGTYLVQVRGTDDVRLLAGEYIDIRTAHSESSSRSLFNDALFNAICIKKTGNY